MATSPRPRTPRYNDALDIRLPPPLPLQKTEVVEKTPICGLQRCQNRVEQHCPDCNSSFCAICMPKRHETLERRAKEDDLDWTPHTRVMPHAEYSAVMKSVKGAIDYQATEAEKQKAMKEDLFVTFDNESILRPGPSFHRLHSDITQHLHIISVIGSSGVGKSSVIKGLVRPGATSFPIPAPPRSGSFTRDLLAYEGIDHSVIIDSEGSKGYEEPILGANQGNGKLLAVDPSKKVDCVSIAYPRLLYTFSTVFCYVSNQQKAAYEHVQELLSYASFASSSIVNPQKYRVLLIVFNKIPLNECIFDIEEATNDWKDKAGDYHSELLSIYSEIRVVYIPTVNDSEGYSDGAQHFHTQRERCYDEIKRFLKNARMSPSPLSMVGRKEQFRLISAAIKRLSENPKEGIDLSELFWSQHREVPPSLCAQVLHYFHSVMRQKLAEDPDIVAAWRFARETVHQRLVDIAYTQYYYHKSETPGVNAAIISEPLSRALRMISMEIRQLAPCSSSYDFSVESKGKVGLVYCQERSSHHIHKSAQQWTEEVPVFLKFKRSVVVPCSWKGNFDPPADKVALEENLKNRLMHLQTSPSDLTTDVHGSVRAFKPYPAMLKASFKELREIHKRYLPPPPLEFCIACFQNSPSFLRNCGHNFCDRCLKLIPDECLVCGDAQRSNPCFVPPLAGTRILSLDGGGIRGIVSVTIMKKLQELCYNMPITKLFDLVSGTSTGGIIALALVCNSRTVSEIRDVYMKLSAAVFEKKSKNPIRLLYGSYYSATTIETELKKEFGEIETAFGSSPHLVVPVSKVSAKKFKLQLFTSYLPTTTKFVLEAEPTEGEQQQDDSKRLFHFKIWEIARATSAAPTYFPPFQTDTGDSYQDGGLLANCPAAVALNEAAILWPKAPVDYLAGVGTGYFDNSSQDTQDGILHFLIRSVTTLTDAGQSWKTALHHKRAPSDFMVRLNPKLSFECELDDHSKMNALEKETDSYFDKSGKDWPLLQKLADKAIASLFFITEIDFETKNDKTLQIKGIITSRTELPIELLAHSLENAFLPSVVDPTVKLTWKTLLQSPPGDRIPRIEFHLPLPLMCSQFSITCKLKSKSGGHADHTISGAPFELESISGKMKIRNRLTHAHPK